MIERDKDGNLVEHYVADPATVEVKRYAVSLVRFEAAARVEGFDIQMGGGNRISQLKRYAQQHARDILHKELDKYIQIDEREGVSLNGDTIIIARLNLPYIKDDEFHRLEREMDQAKTALSRERDALRYKKEMARKYFNLPWYKRWFGPCTKAFRDAIGV